MLGLLGIGNFTTPCGTWRCKPPPLNVTLVGSGMPVWMMLVGRCFWRACRAPAGGGHCCRWLGMLTVLCRGDWQQLLALRLVVGDLYMVLATISWAFTAGLWFAHLSLRMCAQLVGLLLAQMVFGVGWSGVFTGVEWSLGSAPTVWGAPLLAGLAFIAVGPAILAFPLLGGGVQRAVSPVLGVYQPHATVCCADVGCPPGRAPAISPCTGVCAHRRRDCGDLAAQLKACSRSPRGCARGIRAVCVVCKSSQ